VCRIRISSDPELNAGSGSTTIISDLDPENIREKIEDKKKKFFAKITMLIYVENGTIYQLVKLLILLK